MMTMTTISDYDADMIIQSKLVGDAITEAGLMAQPKVKAAATEAA
jgi:hypothetical protein